MNSMKKRQQGASTVTLIIVLALIGAGIYIGLQYIPHRIESATVDSILSDIKKADALKPVREVKDIQGIIARALNINQMEDMRKHFKVTETDDAFVVSVNYQRELNLVYARKQVDYNKSLTLRRRNPAE